MEKNILKIFLKALIWVGFKGFILPLDRGENYPPCLKLVRVMLKT